MIRDIFREILARQASRYLTRRRIRNERAAVHATARRLCEEMGKPVPEALRM